MAKKKEKKKSSAGALVFCAVAAYVAFHAGISTGTTHNATCKELENLWTRNGGSKSSEFMAAEIAKAESAGKRTASHYNKNGTVDRGYWQINSIHGSLSTFRANANAKAAVQLSSNGTDWSPWTTYNNGAYRGQCLWYYLTVS